MNKIKFEQKQTKNEDDFKEEVHSKSDATELEKSSFIIHKFWVHYFFTEMRADLTDFS